MELSEDYEFLAAAITAVTGHLFLSTLVPGPNTKLPPGYHADYLWNSVCLERNTFHGRIQTWFCPKITPKPKKVKENPLNVTTIHRTDKPINIVIDRSSLVIHLKENIQDMDSSRTPPGLQKLWTSGKVMEDWRRISDYQIKDDKILLTLPLGIPPKPSLLDTKMFDSSKNCDFTWLHEDGQIYKRGNHVYKRPYGWNRIALVEDKYDDNKWLGEDPGAHKFRLKGLKDEWPVAYHGKPKLFYEMLLTEESNQGGESRLEKGFYTTPDPCVAEGSAPVFTFKSRKFKVMIQSRVNMNDTSVVRHKKFYVTESPENIRPCGLLIKPV